MAKALGLNHVVVGWCPPPQYGAGCRLLSPEGGGAAEKKKKNWRGGGGSAKKKKK